MIQAQSGNFSLTSKPIENSDENGDDLSPGNNINNNSFEGKAGMSQKTFTTATTADTSDNTDTDNIVVGIDGKEKKDVPAATMNGGTHDKKKGSSSDPSPEEGEGEDTEPVF